jgi:hypothetical protein
MEAEDIAAENADLKAKLADATADAITGAEKVADLEKEIGEAEANAPQNPPDADALIERMASQGKRA